MSNPALSSTLSASSSTSVSVISSVPSSPGTAVSSPMPTATVITKIAGATYTVYASKPSMPGYSDLAFPDGTRGYVICENAGKTTVTTIGDAQKPVDIFGRRQFFCDVAGEGVCSLNGIEYKSIFTPDGVGASYVQDPECSLRIDGEQVTIDMASNGYYCIDNKFLFCVKGLVLGAPIALKTNSKGIRYFELPASAVKVYHDGREEPISDGTTTNMLTKDATNPSIILIDAAAKVREMFYIEMKDGSFANIEMADLVIPTVAVSTSLNGYYDLLHGYRCIPLQPPQISQTTAPISVSLDVTRYNNQTVKVKIPLVWMNAQQEKVYDVRMEAKHPKQDTIIDFSMEASIAQINGSAPGVLAFTTWYSKVDCVFQDGQVGVINVYRDVLPYQTVAGKEYRYTLGEIVSSISSQGAYMIDDKVYTSSARGDNFIAEFDGLHLSIRPRKGVRSYSTYDGSGTWTQVLLKSKIVFDVEYAYFTSIVTVPKIEIAMKIFGDSDPTDSFTYTADGTALNKNIYKLKPDEKAVSESVLATVKFVATDADKNTYPFVVTFLFKEFSRVSFIISDNEDFCLPYFKRASFQGLGGFAPFWTYGPFIGQANVPIHAFGNEVTNGSLDSNIYPPISFNDGTAGTINKTNGCLEIKTQVLTDDVTIPVGPNDEYLRLNACPSVKYTGSSITVPKNASVSFFRLGNTIYLMRASMTRTTSLHGFSSRSASPTTTPAAESSLSPPPVRVVPSGAARAVPVPNATSAVQVVRAVPQAKPATVARLPSLPEVTPATAVTKIQPQRVGSVTRAVPSVVAVLPDTVTVRPSRSLRSARLHA